MRLRLLLLVKALFFLYFVLLSFLLVLLWQCSGKEIIRSFFFFLYSRTYKLFELCSASCILCEDFGSFKDFVRAQIRSFSSCKGSFMRLLLLLLVKALLCFFL
jgi:hypothetical protein